MPGRILFAVLAAAGACHPGMAMAAEPIVLEGREIRVMDLARLDEVERARFGGLVVATIPAGRSRLDLDSARRAALLRRRVPGRDWPLLSPGVVRFQAGAHGRAAAGTRGARGCFMLRQDVHAGDYLGAEDVLPAPCRDRTQIAALRFDRRVNAPLACAHLSAGAYLGRMAVRGQAIVSAGSRLRLVTRDGPVTVERRVRAMQPARMGRNLFVRGEEESGPIFSSRLAAPAGAATP